ncbi:Predicted metalloprotease, contains C-terminal PDZ domain [Catalinimonas alkaloidigena]|uniref:Predicted metalloprotease, contains C-terminal PDZ domain n=1 Tax=Catalinimonas alkaloidigena TaxID=1075417 RepID=A0A1G9PLR3_9BACT|nr:PDZ domain-containing protein [Catalinimonas alkaloidigena]SDL99157.1 Predicted metalloprotease, contains C-terminal PDZ domain [Catalinimonas alkaloidigena]
MHHFRTLTFFFCFFCFCAAQAAPSLAYRLKFEAPQAHYFVVEMDLDGFRQKFVDLKIPVWTPGSYLVREYARHVEGFTAKDGNNQDLRWEKINKNTWRIYSNRAAQIRVRYDVYANELTVRTSHVDASHGYINGASAFLYPAEQQALASTLTVEPYEGWNRVSTSLLQTGNEPFVYRVPNYDILVDSPLEIGTHETFRFTAAGVPHEVAIWGVGSQGSVAFDSTQLKTDMAKIVERAKDVFGEHPCDRYTFIIHAFPGGGGGLEHLNSTTCQTTPATFQDDGRYRGFLGLISHEYFHLWNVKRLRPRALGPFNYDEENYTHMLWVAEGFTAYYDDYLVHRAGFTSADQWLGTLAGNINSVENRPGRNVQSLAEASFDAWIKAYRPDENSQNSQVTYYTQGAVMAMLLDLTILHETNGQKTLDDAMQTLYNRYYKQLGRGYTDEEFMRAISETAGKDLSAFFSQYVFGTQVPEYDDYFAYVGLKLKDRNQGNEEAWLGASLNSEGKVRFVYRDSPAWQGGLNTEDVILAVNEWTVSNNNLNDLIGLYQPGDEVTLTVSRHNRLVELPVTLVANPQSSYTFEPVDNISEQQRSLLQQWVNRGTNQN